MENKTMIEVITWFGKYIKKNYGKRCKDFDIGCCVCQKWLAHDILADCLINENA